MTNLSLAMQPEATVPRVLVDTTTWGELDRRAGALSRRGVGFGDRVLILPRDPAGKVLGTELGANFGVAKEIDAGESSTPPTVSAGAQAN